MQPSEITVLSCWNIYDKCAGNFSDIYAFCIKDIQTQINKYLKSGWEIHGELKINSIRSAQGNIFITLNQMMAKYESPKPDICESAVAKSLIGLLSRSVGGVSDTTVSNTIVSDTTVGKSGLPRQSIIDDPST
jgi:hypothetical protein